jgi:hypothetical protein
MNSSTPLQIQTLAAKITPSRVKIFLEDLANLREEQNALWRFVKRHRELLHSLTPAVFIDGKDGRIQARSVASPLSVGSALMSAYAQSKGMLIGMGPILALGALLRECWKQPSTLGREVGIWRIWADLLSLSAATGTHPQSVRHDPLILLLDYAIHLADRMRCCSNPECPARYFVAKRRSQKYCSEKCAEPAQRLFKRTWWDEHGKQARKKQKARAARKRKVPRKEKGR